MGGLFTLLADRFEHHRNAPGDSTGADVGIFDRRCAESFVKSIMHAVFPTFDWGDPADAGEPYAPNPGLECGLLQAGGCNGQLTIVASADAAKDWTAGNGGADQPDPARDAVELLLEKHGEIADTLQAVADAFEAFGIKPVECPGFSAKVRRFNDFCDLIRNEFPPEH